MFRYQTAVKGSVSEPIINVTDISFGSVVVGASAKKSFQVSNQGIVKLTVSNQSGVLPAGSPYTSTSDALTTGSPLVLDVADSTTGNTKSYDITFAPIAVGTYNATITFSSDASTVDSVCVITGVGSVASDVTAADETGENAILSIVPNPVGSGTFVVTSLLRNTGIVLIDIVNTQGKVAASLVSELRQPGSYSDSFTSGSLAQGSYLLRMQCNGTTIVRTIQVGGR